MRRLVGTLGMLVFVALGAVGAIRVWNMAGSAYDAMTFPAHVAPGLAPQLKASDAYRITLDYLNRASASAEPATSVAPSLTSIWAVTADQAAALDGCIPTGKGSGVVWVTKGQGTYLNVGSHPWSSPTGSAVCSNPGPAGTIVIDDATGAILGVYPYAGPSYPHPSPQVTLAPASAAPFPSVSSSASPSPSAAPSPSASTKPSSSAKPSGSPKPSASGG
jgi:hypothetical protein